MAQIIDTTGTGRIADLAESRGMTLFELVVAIAIFSLIAGAGYAGMDQGLAVEKRLSTERLYWQRLDSLYTLLQTDLMQATAVPDGTGADPSPAFIGYRNLSYNDQDILFRFIRGGYTMSLTGPPDPARCIAYIFKEGSLYRSSRTCLGLAFDQTNPDVPLLIGVTGIQIRYLASGVNWTDHWHDTPPFGDPAALPRAVELQIEMEGKHRYRWLFHVGAPG
jgi:general secretion pathway protein J